jgi:hypothetical protein
MQLRAVALVPTDFKLEVLASRCQKRSRRKNGLRHVPIGSSKFRIAQLRGMMEVG